MSVLYCNNGRCNTWRINHLRRQWLITTIAKCVRQKLKNPIYNILKCIKFTHLIEMDSMFSNSNSGV